MQSIKLQILLASHLEHFKAAKDLALIYPIEHKKRKQIETALNEIQNEINSLRNESN
jgi:hypothetical protein